MSSLANAMVPIQELESRRVLMMILPEKEY
jgi:hypothetical protein